MSATQLAQIPCPVCDSTDVKQRTEKKKIGDTLTGYDVIDEHICACANCGQEGDFVGRNDDIYKVAMQTRVAAKKVTNA